MSNEEVSSGIAPDTAVLVSHDIYIGKELAFAKGDILKVEAVVPNVDRPQYKYVVYSKRLQKKFQLSSDDVIEYAAGTTEVIPSVVSGSSQRSAGDKRTEFIIVAVAILLTIVGVGAYSFWHYNKSEKKSTTVNEQSGEQEENTTESTPASSSPQSQPASAPAPAAETAPSPPPDTGPKPEEITLDEYNQIQSGMTYEQVVAIVGGPGLNSADVPGFDYTPPENGAAYTFFGHNPSSVASVVFQYGVVIDKYQQGL